MVAASAALVAATVEEQAHHFRRSRFDSIPSGSTPLHPGAALSPVLAARAAHCWSESLEEEPDSNHPRAVSEMAAEEAWVGPVMDPRELPRVA
jgi:hypothetical protein